MKNDVYWFIAVCQRLDLDKNGFPDTGFLHPCGFYKDKKDALEILHKNITNLWERSYHYALMEPYYEGSISGYGTIEDRQFFKYDPEVDGYREIAEPEGYEFYPGLIWG